MIVLLFDKRRGVRSVFYSVPVKRRHKNAVKCQGGENDNVKSGHSTESRLSRAPSLALFCAILDDAGQLIDELRLLAETSLNGSVTAAYSQQYVLSDKTTTYVNGLVLAQLQVRVRSEALVLVHAEGGVQAALGSVGEDTALRLRSERAVL